MILDRYLNASVVDAKQKQMNKKHIEMGKRGRMCRGALVSTSNTHSNTGGLRETENERKTKKTWTTAKRKLSHFRPELSRALPRATAVAVPSKCLICFYVDKRKGDHSFQREI